MKAAISLRMLLKIRLRLKDSGEWRTEWDIKSLVYRTMYPLFLNLTDAGGMACGYRRKRAQLITLAYLNNLFDRDSLEERL
jgi:hypothetical protein